jgi:putative hemolysin
VAGIVIVVMAITFASLILGELVPKRIALANAEAIAARVARPLLFVAMMAAPVVYVLRVTSETILRLMRITLKPRSGVTEEEVKTLIAEGTQSGVFDKTEQRMIQGVLGLADQSIRAIMTPRPDVVWLDIDDAPEDIRTVIAGTSFSRLLVSRGSVDELVGIVQKKDMVAACLAGRALDIAASVRKPLVVPGTVTILQMLEMFKTTSIHLAVAVNEYGSVQGVITLTDIVKAIAGDIPEHAGAVVPDYTTRDDGSYLMDGAMPIALAREVLRLSEVPGDSPYYTLAGLTMAALGRVPREGDRFDWEAWTFEVVDMDGNRIDKLLVSPRKPS